jgi:hypothetical protein
MKTPFDYLGQSVGCVCFPDQPDCCMCPDGEAVLRAYENQREGLPAMTAEQREWCLDEIASVERHKREDYEGASDKDLARGVMSAWLDYCRDKGQL